MAVPFLCSLLVAASTALDWQWKTAGSSRTRTPCGVVDTNQLGRPPVADTRDGANGDVAAERVQAATHPDAAHRPNTDSLHYF